MVYMDDVFIASLTPAEDQARTRRVLLRCRKEQLRLNPEKCEFATQSTDYLGYRVTPNGLTMDTTKLDGILSWPTLLQ